MFIHLGCLDDFALQELHDFLDVALADEVSDEIQHFLVNLKRDHCLILDDGEDVVYVILENLHVVMSELQDFLKNDDLHIVVIVLLQQVQVALNGHFNSARSRRELCDRVCALKQHRWTLRLAHHENGAHETLLLRWVRLAYLPEHLKDHKLEDVTDFRDSILSRHECLKVVQGALLIKVEQEQE